MVRPAASLSGTCMEVNNIEGVHLCHCISCFAVILRGKIDGSYVLACQTAHTSNDPTSSIPLLYRYVNYL